MDGCMDAWMLGVDGSMDGWRAPASPWGTLSRIVAHNFPGFKTYFEKLWAQLRHHRRPIRRARGCEDGGSGRRASIIDSSDAPGAARMGGCHSGIAIGV